MSDLSSTSRLGGTRTFAILARVFHAGLTLSGLALTAAAFLPLLHPFWPLASVAEHFALQILVGAALLGGLATILRRWRWLGMAMGIAFIQIWTIHPYWPGFVTHSHTASLQSGALKVVSLNVHYRGDSFDAVRRYLSDSQADVIGLVEVTPRWKAELAPLRGLYPYSVDCIDADIRCEEMLLSKHPLLRSAAARVNGRLPVLTWAEIAPPGGGGLLTFAVSHVVWPLMAADAPTPAEGLAQPPLPSGLPRLAQAEQIENLATGLAALGPDLVLMGDFNAAPWSRIQQSLRLTTGLDNQGFLAPSWPSWGPTLIRLPIDHILTRGQPHLTSFQPGPYVGSDHLPVEAVLGFAQS